MLIARSELPPLPILGAIPRIGLLVIAIAVVRLIRVSISVRRLVSVSIVTVVATPIRASIHIHMMAGMSRIRIHSYRCTHADMRADVPCDEHPPRFLQ